VLALLERDEPDRALVTFYGKLAQGMTRDTFIDGDTSGIEPLDKFAVRWPAAHSAANAHFLLMLGYMLVQDYDSTTMSRRHFASLLRDTRRCSRTE